MASIWCKKLIWLDIFPLNIICSLKITIFLELHHWDYYKEIIVILCVQLWLFSGMEIPVKHCCTLHNKEMYIALKEHLVIPGNNDAILQSNHIPACSSYISHEGKISPFHKPGPETTVMGKKMAMLVIATLFYLHNHMRNPFIHTLKGLIKVYMYQHWILHLYVELSFFRWYGQSSATI